MWPGRGEGATRRGGSSPATPGAAGRGTAAPAPSSRPAAAHRSAMAAEEADGLAMSRPHYGCEYRGRPGTRAAAQQRTCPATPCPARPALPVPSRGRCWEWRLGRRRRGGSRGASALGPARGRGGPRRLSARAPGRGPPCLPWGGRRGARELVQARRPPAGVSEGRREKAVDGQRRGVPRPSRRRLPRAGSAPRPRCPPRGGGGGGSAGRRGWEGAPRGPRALPSSLPRVSAPAPD